MLYAKEKSCEDFKNSGRTRAIMYLLLQKAGGLLICGYGFARVGR
jgi:hypothetical protein